MLIFFFRNHIYGAVVTTFTTVRWTTAVRASGVRTVTFV